MPLPDDFFDTMDSLIDDAAEGMKARLHAEVAVARLTELFDESDPRANLPKAALCVLLRHEVNQWRPLLGETWHERQLLSYL